MLQDIPLLGNLFTSRSDSKDRTETIVLIRPTVLKTPELAAAQAIKEQRRLPGISAAAAADAISERRQVEAERRAELRSMKAQSRLERLIPKCRWIPTPSRTRIPDRQRPFQFSGGAFVSVSPPGNIPSKVRIGCNGTSRSFGT